MRQCHYCGANLTRHNARICADCRPAHKRLRNLAHLKVMYAVKRGRLPNVETLKCVDCGAGGWYWEHRSYDHPLDVQPVCEKCNRKRGIAYTESLIRKP